MKAYTPQTIARKVTIVLYPADWQKLNAKSSNALAIAVNVKQSIQPAKCLHVDLSQEPLVAQRALPTKNPKKMNK